MGVVSWFRNEFVPWTQGRMFRTGIPLDQPIVVSNRVVTIPNGITLLRALGLPAFVWLAAVSHAWLAAFLLLGVLAMLDSVDGYVARRFNQVSRLGSIIDPLSDRLTVTTVGVTLAVVGAIPLWLVVLVVGRDVLLMALAFAAAYIPIGLAVPVSQIPVSRTGKLATWTLFIGLPLLVLAELPLVGRSVIHGIALSVTCVGGALYYLAFAQYLRASIALRRARIPASGEDR